MVVKFCLAVALVMYCLAGQAVANPNSIGPDKATLLSLKARAEPFAKHGAVLLSRRNQVNVNDKLFETARFYRAIYLTNEEAVSDYSKLVNSFNAYYHNSKIEFARVITPEGQIFEMQKDAISEVSANSDDYLDDMKQIEFAVPQLKVGNIIEYQIFEEQTKPIIEGQWFSSVGFRYIKFLPQKNWLRIDPILESTNTLTLPASTPFYTKNRNTDIAPVITKKDGNVQYVWQMTDLDGIEVESGMPPIDDMQPAVYVSTMNDWQTIDDWYADMFTPTQVKAQNITELASKLFAGLNSEREKVKAVFEYVQKNVRYIGAHVNRGGYQQHTAEEVLNNAYGDCKDQTTLIIALLSEGGVQAFPALVNTYTGNLIFDDLPVLDFNHMITYVASKDGGYWLDTSGQTGTFPGITAQFGDRTTFVVDGKKGRLVTIPAIQPKDNVANVNIDYRVENKQIGIDVKMAFNGDVETNLRNYYQYSPEKLMVIEQLLSPFAHDNRVSSYVASDPADISTPFVVSGEFNNLLTLGDEIVNFHYSMGYSQILKVFTGFSTMEPPASRQQGLHIQVPITVNIESVYPSPWDKARLVNQNMARNFQNPYFEVTHTAEANDDKVIAKTTFVLFAQTISAEDYPDFYAAIDGFQKQSESMFVFEKILAKPSVNDDVSLEDKIARSRAMLDNAEFEHALEYITALAAGHQDNGEVQYLLGIVQGFNGNDEASDSAFKRAEALGYQY